MGDQSTRSHSVPQANVPFCHLGSAPSAPVLGYACLPNFAGFSFAFAGRGGLLTVAFTSVLLGAADATGETNLAAHRRSNFLSR